MLLKAGALSLALLLVSRALGLLRESALAATFGTSGLADVAVLMLTLPDWLAGVVASGALAYVLLPAWVSQASAEVAATQRRVALMLLAAGSVLALALAMGRHPAVAWLAGGVTGSLRPLAATALLWSALALPAALLAGLWTTRLQHERDFLGLYSAGIVVNLVLLAAIATAALAPSSAAAVTWLGGGLLAAMLLRLGWLGWRQGPQAPPAARAGAPGLPPPPVWLWAILSAGLPLALPFAARSMASQSGEGALATFNYAWKLIELPLLLAIQLVATLSFPAVVKALSSPLHSTAQDGTDEPVRTAFALAFTLACACAAGLLAGAPALTQLLFGWGRMEPQSLEQIAQWARIGAWGLLPQSLIAVALTVLAVQRRMKAAVAAYAVALLILLAIAGTASAMRVDGAVLMRVLNALLLGVATVSVLAMGRQGRRWLPWGVMAAALAALLLVAATLALLPAPATIGPGLLAAALCASVVLATAWLASAGQRKARLDNRNSAP
ncbi:MAG: hypothetical protein LH617_14780 [Ramlibacter sp.]|nr:hypothetical protein [Ramlibacter sp.]